MSQFTLCHDLPCHKLTLGCDLSCRNLPFSPFMFYLMTIQPMAFIFCCEKYENN